METISVQLLEANKRLLERRKQEGIEILRRDAVTASWEMPPCLNISPAPTLPIQRPSLESETVKIYPSLAAGIMKAEETAVGRVWLLLRHLDQQGQGWLSVADVRKHVTGKDSPLRICGWRRLRQVLQQGKGMFWKRDNKDRIWIYGAAVVARNLSIERLQGKPVLIPLKSLVEGLESVKAAFYSAYHAGRDNSPVARSKLRELTGISERSQRHYDHVAKVERTANFDITEARTKASAEEHAWQYGHSSFEFTDYGGKQGEGGKTYNAQRLPNSYISPLACAALGRQRKVNRQLVDLVNYGVQGNGEKTLNRLFHTNAKSAARARSRSEDVYLQVQARPNVHYAIWTRL